MGSDKTALENLLGKPFTDNLKDFWSSNRYRFPLKNLSGTKDRQVCNPLYLIFVCHEGPFHVSS